MSVRNNVSAGHCQCGTMFVRVIFNLAIVFEVKTADRKQNNLNELVKCQCGTMSVRDTYSVRQCG